MKPYDTPHETPLVREMRPVQIATGCKTGLDSGLFQNGTPIRQMRSLRLPNEAGFLRQTRPFATPHETAFHVKRDRLEEGKLWRLFSFFMATIVLVRTN